MAKHLEISITASIPDDKDELGHEAIIASRDGVNAVIDALNALGLIGVKRKSRLFVRHPKKATVPGEAMFRRAPRQEAEDDAA
jgi:hypothetical protein